MDWADADAPVELGRREEDSRLEVVGPVWMAGGVEETGRDLPKLEFDGFMIVRKK